jgi:hypothetical protein
MWSSADGRAKVSTDTVRVWRSRQPTTETAETINAKATSRKRVNDYSIGFIDGAAADMLLAA